MDPTIKSNVPGEPQAMKGPGEASSTSGRDRKTMEKASRDFESFMIYMMLKEMDKMTQVNKKGYMEETYMTVVYEKVADHLARKGVGITDMIMKYFEGKGH